MNRTEKMKERCSFLFFAILILGIRLWYTAKMQGPFVFSDQVGYWGHAANLNALPWQNATGVWYSYGYSILLAPLYWISHDMGIMYKLALIINAFMGVISFVLGVAILRELEEKIDILTAEIISFSVSCYSAYLFQSYIGWPETLIYTGILLVVWTMIRFCKKTTMLNMVILILELVGLYVVHNRNIVAIIAFVIVLLVMFFTKKIDGKKVIVAFVFLGCLYLVNKGIRVHLTELAFGGECEFGGNSTSSTISGLKTILNSSDGWIHLVQSLIGKIWYILTATFMLAYTGFLFVFNKIIKLFKEAQKKNVKNSFYFYLFIMLLTLGTIVVNALFIMRVEKIDYSQSTRLDVFFYGRYSDGITGFLIAFGLLDLLKDKKHFFREKLIGLGIYILCSSVLYLQLYKIEDFWMNSMQVPGVYFVQDFSVDSIKKISIIVIMIYVIGNIIKKILIYESRHMKEIIQKMVSLLLVLVFCLVGNNAIQACIVPGQNWIGYYEEVYDILNNNSSNKIYFLPDNLNGVRCILRTQAVEGEFEYDTIPSMEEENYFVIVSDDEGAENIDLLSKDYYLVCHTEEIYLICEGDEIVRNLAEEGCNCSKIVDCGFEQTAEGKKYVIKTEEIAFAERMLGKKILTVENVDVEANELKFGNDSNIMLQDDEEKKDYTYMNMQIDLLIENQGNVEIINKWNGWLDDMTFSVSYHVDDNKYYFNISQSGYEVYTCSWKLEDMPKDIWNTLNITFDKGSILVKINEKIVVKEECGFESLHASSQPIRVGNGMVGKVKEFKYDAK